MDRSETVATMEEGSKNGQFKTYDRDGKLILEGSFLGGRLHGENTGYYTDGSVQHKFHYKDGKKTGTNVEYFPSGKIKMKEQVAANGIDASVEELDETGLVKSEKKLRNGAPHGLTIYYHEGKKIPKVKESYENGKLNGIRYTYYPSGKIQKEESFKFNLLTGPLKTYYESGALESTGEYQIEQATGLVHQLSQQWKSQGAR